MILSGSPDKRRRGINARLMAWALPQIDLNSPDSFLIQICIFLSSGPVFIRTEIQWEVLLFACSRRVLNTYACIQAAVCTHSSLGSRASLHTNCRFKIYTQMTCGQEYLFRTDHLISTSEDADSRCFVKVTALPWVERMLEHILPTDES